jgi:hypothetical protein
MLKFLPEVVHSLDQFNMVLNSALPDKHPRGSSPRAYSEFGNAQDKD